MLKDRKGALGNNMAMGIFIIILLIIAAGIFLGFSIFFGVDYGSVKQLEADSLNGKVRNCILEKNINWQVADIANSFLIICSINKNSVDNSGLLIKVCSDNEDCINSISYNILIVGQGFNGGSQACGFTGTGSTTNYPRCFSSNFTKESHNYYVITGTNQFIRRLS